MCCRFRLQQRRVPRWCLAGHCTHSTVHPHNQVYGIEKRGNRTKGVRMQCAGSKHNGSASAALRSSPRLPSSNGATHSEVKNPDLILTSREDCADDDHRYVRSRRCLAWFLCSVRMACACSGAMREGHIVPCWLLVGSKFINLAFHFESMHVFGWRVKRDAATLLNSSRPTGTRA
jgi:hypothetical protein